ncbi:MAG: hypothetical protein JHC25_04070 [Thermodesulfobacterium sp.]|jgi:hypothetical protein|nr:hypothetical protein [Thermodesulfobacterium sp.]MCI4459148.1 hypothetical protein [Thermocrinis sp.]
MGVKKIYARRSGSTRLDRQTKPIRRYYQVYVHILPDLVKAFGDLLSSYAKEVISQVVGMDWKDLNKLPKDAVEEYYTQAKGNKKGFYVEKEVHEKWNRMPKALKKKAQYMVNQLLLEKRAEVEL